MSDFLLDAGTHGFIATPFDLLTTELNAKAAGSASLSSVNGTSGVFTQTNTVNAIFGNIFFTCGGSFTPVAGQCLYGWFVMSKDGTAFEAQKATPSATVMALPRSPDFVIPFAAAAHVANDLVFSAARRILLPNEDFKILTQVSGGATTLPSTGNKLTLGPMAAKF